jgi:hypothetical protein
VGTLELPPFKQLLDLVQREAVLREKTAELARQRVAVARLVQLEKKPVGQIESGAFSVQGIGFHVFETSLRQALFPLLLPALP